MGLSAFFVAVPDCSLRYHWVWLFFLAYAGYKLEWYRRIPWMLVTVVVLFGYLFWEQRQINEALACYALPRVITAQQSEEIVKAISEHGSFDYRFVVKENDREVDATRAAIARILLKANWRLPESGGVDEQVSVEQGIQIRYGETVTYRESRKELPPREQITPDVIFRDAFRDAGVHVEGGASSASALESGRDYEVTISIGEPIRSPQWCDRLNDREKLGPPSR